MSRAYDWNDAPDWATSAGMLPQNNGMFWFSDERYAAIGANMGPAYLVFNSANYPTKDHRQIKMVRPERKQTAAAVRVNQLKSEIKTHLIDDAIDALGGKWDLQVRSLLGDSYLISHGGEYAVMPSAVDMSHFQSLPKVQYICTKAEFESRKAERQNKPDWKDAPEWAQWLAQDGTGLWVWFKSQPARSESLYWAAKGKRCSGACEGNVIGNWQDTLEQRPEVAKGANPHKKITKEDLAKAGYIFCSDFLGHVKAKSAHSEPEKAVEEVLQAEAERMRSFLLTIASDKALFSKIAKPEPAKADWYDYERRQALKLPPVGVVCEVQAGRRWSKTHIVAHHIDGDRAICCDDGFSCGELAYCAAIAFRPLDWDHNKPEVEPEQSPELSFHLATAQNELTSSAKLLPAESSLLQSITGVIAAIQAIREAV